MNNGPVDFSLDPYAGGTYGRLPILPVTSTTGDNVLNHLVSGSSIDPGRDGVITYSFNANQATGWLAARHYPGYLRDANGNLIPLAGGANFSPLSPEQQAAARAAIGLWDDLIAPEFREVNGVGNADIILANSSDPGQAFAYYGGSYHGAWDGFLGDVFIRHPSENPSNGQLAYGEYGSTTLVHELGHSLGLSHPGEYNGVGTFATDAEYAQDTYQYSVMSYFNGSNSGQLAFNWNMGGFYASYPQGPQLHDIVAIQAIYGADPTTRTGNTTYGFGSNTGNELFDFEANPYPMYSIYDAGGIDTIDASGFNVSQYINLQPGSFSSIGGGAPSADAVNAYWTDYYADYGLDFSEEVPFSNAEIAANQAAAQQAIAARIARDTGVTGVGATEYDNVSIAYGTVIENAIGGSARDLLRGNDAANRLEGRGGNDVLQGFAGNDTLVGGTGDDTLTGGSGSDLFVFANDQSRDTITDFQTGADLIDLRGVAGATASSVTYNAATRQVQIDTDANGTADMFINVSNAVGAGDYLFSA